MSHRYGKSLLLPLAIACAVMPSLAWADTKADLEARYAELKTALETREPEQIKPLVTPDFAEVGLDGKKQTIDEMIDKLSMIPVDPARKAKVTIESVSEEGAVAHVMSRESTSGSREGRDGQTHSFALSRLSHDTWVKSDKGWQLRLSEAQEMTMSRDGQIMRTLKKGDEMPQRGMGRPGGSGRGGPGGPGGGERPYGPPAGDGPPMGGGSDD